jgi:hypothetical protein
MAIRYIHLLAASLISFAATAQKSDSVTIKKISDEIMTNGKAYDNLRYLCKDIGQRLSGSSNAQKAVEATVRMLKDAGADTVYLQPCMVPHWVRGKKEQGYIQLPGGTKYDLHLCALGNSVGTINSGVSAPVVEVRSFDELDMLGEKIVKGKIIFFNFAMNPTYIRTFEAYRESGSARRNGPSAAAKYGAIAVMVRSLASNVDDYPHTGATGYNDSFPKIPAVAISTKDAEWLSSQIKRKMQLTAWFKTNCQMLADAPSFNVIGEIHGTETPQEIITVGGHLDSWDLAEGAQDDGAGCVQSIEVIRALKAAGIRPKRTVRAVMFMNEENGGRGGKAYRDAARKNKEQHIFALESDGGGFTPRAISFGMKEEKQKKVDQWKPLFYPYSVYEFNSGGGGSDVEPLEELGIPVGELSPDSQRYFDQHHAANDVFESVSKRELLLGAVNMAAMIWLVSEHGL